MPHRLTHADYTALAQVRYEIRRFLMFSETMARASGIEPQQHQLLLALQGLPNTALPTIGVLAERLQIQAHSTAELVSRSVRSGLVKRVSSSRDRREVKLIMTARGHRLLAKLSRAHHTELRSAAPALLRALLSIVISDSKPRAKTPTVRRPARPEVRRR